MHRRCCSGLSDARQSLVWVSALRDAKSIERSPLPSEKAQDAHSRRLCRSLLWKGSAFPRQLRSFLLRFLSARLSLAETNERLSCLTPESHRLSAIVRGRAPVPSEISNYESPIKLLRSSKPNTYAGVIRRSRPTSSSRAMITIPNWIKATPTADRVPSMGTRRTITPRRTSDATRIAHQLQTSPRR